MSAADPLGLILAGGESRRYGAPKALEPVGGVRIIDRVRSTLEAVVDTVGIVANEPDLFADLGLPTRPDVVPGIGALGGVYTAVCWARDEGRAGALVVACDMPFLSRALLRWLLEAARSGEPAPDVVVPESAGPRGVEPLCAWYGAGCATAIEARLERGERHVIGFYGDVRVRRLARAEIAELGDPDRMFLNVNTRQDRRRAESLAADTDPAGGADPDAGPEARDGDATHDMTGPGADAGAVAREAAGG